MSKPEPLALDAAIPDKDAAIKFGGGAGDHATIQIHAYIEDEAEVTRLLRLRGQRFKLVFVTGEDMQRSQA